MDNGGNAPFCAPGVRFGEIVGPSGTDILCKGMHEAGKRCTELLERTTNALNDSVVSVMFLAIQKGNLELSINCAVTESVFKLQPYTSEILNVKNARDFF